MNKDESRKSSHSFSDLTDRAFNIIAYRHKTRCPA